MSDLSNEINTLVSDSRVCDDFIVPSGGWVLDVLWTNDLMTTTASTAYWDIRSGVSAGDGGTLLFSGTNAATQTPTGRSGSGYTEYTMEVTGLIIPLGAGTYWLTVAPIDDGAGQSWVDMTSGLNAVGSPPGNDYNSFWDSLYFGYYFGPPGPYLYLGSVDFSMGVAGSRGTPVPEPCTLALFGLGASGLLRRRSRKNRYPSGTAHRTSACQGSAFGGALPLSTGKKRTRGTRGRHCWPRTWQS